MKFPGGPTYWEVNGILHISIPFTWNLPEVKTRLKRGFMMHSKVIVGGPAICIMPTYFNDIDFIEVGTTMPGVLQRVNPMATRTTTGCIRRCKFCAIGSGMIEPGGLVELQDWPNLPIICDNNLLACTPKHFDKVIDRLVTLKNVDFNQGLDSRLLTEYHARRLKEIKKPIIRLALDSMAYVNKWLTALDLLLFAKIPKSSIRSYAIIALDSGPEEAWKRCEFIESKGVLALPMWFHELDCLQSPIITTKQKELGWNWLEYRGIMAWYYHHTDLQIRKKYIGH